MYAQYKRSRCLRIAEARMRTILVILTRLLHCWNTFNVNNIQRSVGFTFRRARVSQTCRIYVSWLQSAWQGDGFMYVRPVSQCWKTRNCARRIIICSWREWKKWICRPRCTVFVRLGICNKLFLQYKHRVNGCGGVAYSLHLLIRWCREKVAVLTAFTWVR